ncbi:YceD family protein [Pararhizobium sp. DWP1-1-3]|uniref:YceD family protein n=1 Tax=Pararhizobium sp. DWP1-1-3 TaxID=2804652 RepID=UPI003CE99ACD
MNHDEKPAFSYPVKVGNISANAVTVRLEANEAERKALRDLWNVLEVKSVAAELQVARWKRDGVKIKGRVKARIVQACVVTLEPVESNIDEPVEAIFVPEGSRLARIAANDSGEMILDPEGPDLPDVFTGDTIDVGVTVTEHAALAIDPYPRKAGVSFGERIESSEKDDVRPNPFAVLKDWKKD